jgi:transcriptional regulator with XRE-family HTH domain
MRASPTRAALLKRFAENVRRTREARGLSQSSLAILADISRPRLNQLEQAKQDPRVSTVLKIALALKVPISQLLEQDHKLINGPSSRMVRSQFIND